MTTVAFLNVFTKTTVNIYLNLTVRHMLLSILIYYHCHISIKRICMMSCHYVWCHVFLDGSLWWAIIITFLLLDEKSGMNAHLFGSLTLLGSWHVFRIPVYVVYVDMPWNSTETHWNLQTSNLLNRHEHETKPNSGEATLSQYISCPMPQYICN